MADDIAKSLAMSSGDIDLSWLLGMLHDIGRFEQVRRYGTFQDGQSVNHAALSADILFGGPGVNQADSEAEAVPAAKEAPVHEEQKACGIIWRFLEDSSEDRLIEKAVRLHNVYHLPEKMTEREYRFATLLRDADKIDILRVNCETPRSEIYDIPEEACSNRPISWSMPSSHERSISPLLIARLLAISSAT